MFSSRSLHFAVLGIILGACVGYIVAFYQAENRPQAALPPEHPPVAAGDPALAALKSAVDRDPNDVDMLARYAYALFTAGRMDDAIVYWVRALQLRPDDVNLRSLLAAVPWREGKTEDARKHLQIAIQQSPRHIPTLHAMFLITLETDHDEKKAAEILDTIEGVDPNYSGLSDLRERMKGQRAPAGD